MVRYRVREAMKEEEKVSVCVFERERGLDVPMLSLCQFINGKSCKLT